MVSENPKRRRAATVELLLDAALQTFADQGFAAASVEDICRRGGFTRGAFYSSFATKHELFAALMTRELARHLADAERLLADVAGAADPLVAAVDRVTGLLDDSRTWTLVLTEYQLLAARDPAAATLLAEHLGRAAGQVTEVVERATRAAGVTLAVPAAEVARSFVALHHGLALGAVSDPQAPAALGRTALLALLRGVTTAPDTTP